MNRSVATNMVQLNGNADVSAGIIQQSLDETYEKGLVEVADALQKNLQEKETMQKT